MPLWPQFIGGSYQARSATLDNEACINLMLETIDSQENAKRAMLVGTPALKYLTAASDLGCRGGYSIDGRTFLVIGATLYEFNITTNVATSRGSIANDGKPVSMVSNGRGGEQLLIVGGGEVKVLTLTTNSLSAAISLPLTNAPVQGDFIDGYFLLTEANTIRVWFSALENGASWNALNFFSRSHVADNVVGMKVCQNRIWVFGSLTSETFYDSGDATTPFIPYPGSLIQQGAVTAWAIVAQEDLSAISWLSRNSQGYGRILRATNYTPEPISTPAVEFAIASYSSITDAEAAAYQQEGHPCSVFTFPTGDATWVFDHRESRWHQRAAYDSVTALRHRWRARSLCAADSTMVIAGDYASGSIYKLDLDTFADFCGPLQRVRRAPYPSSENQWLFLDSVELGVQAGVGLVSGQGSNPTINLRVSRDNGNTYSSTVTASPGTMNNWQARAIWNRLGRARADRLVIEVSQTDPVRTIWGPGAWLRVTPGSGQL